MFVARRSPKPITDDPSSPIIQRKILHRFLQRLRYRLHVRCLHRREEERKKERKTKEIIILMRNQIKGRKKTKIRVRGNIGNLALVGRRALRRSAWGYLGKRESGPVTVRDQSESTEALSHFCLTSVFFENVWYDH